MDLLQGPKWPRESWGASILLHRNLRELFSVRPQGDGRREKRGRRTPGAFEEKQREWKTPVLNEQEAVRAFTIQEG